MNEVTWIVAADGPPTDVYEERRRGGPMQRLAAARTAILNARAQGWRRSRRHAIPPVGYVNPTCDECGQQAADLSLIKVRIEPSVMLQASACSRPAALWRF